MILRVQFEICWLAAPRTLWALYSPRWWGLPACQGPSSIPVYVTPFWNEVTYTCIATNSVAFWRRYINIRRSVQEECPISKKINFILDIHHLNGMFIHPLWTIGSSPCTLFNLLWMFLTVIFPQHKNSPTTRCFWRTYGAAAILNECYHSATRGNGWMKFEYKREGSFYASYKQQNCRIKSVFNIAHYFWSDSGSYHNSWQYPSSCLLFKTRHFGDWILSSSSGGTYLRWAQRIEPAAVSGPTF